MRKQCAKTKIKWYDTKYFLAYHSSYYCCTVNQISNAKIVELPSSALSKSANIEKHYSEGLIITHTAVVIRCTCFAFRRIVYVFVLRKLTLTTLILYEIRISRRDIGMG